MIVRTDAVVLKSMNYRESSRILTLYTRDFGKQSVLAKGVRGAKSKLAGVTEPLNYVQAVFYKKENRDLQLLSQCDSLRSWRRLTEDLDRMGPAMAIAELTYAVSHDEEGNGPQFDLLVACLDAINDAKSNAQNVFYLFEVRLLDILGFRPDFLRCGSCGAEIGSEQAQMLAADPAGGGLFCGECASGGRGLMSLSQGAVNVLRKMQSVSDCSTVTRIALPVKMRSEIAGLLWLYLQSHIEGLKSLKSESVFAAIS
jgi:DNA repair protein RecO (recombination protein O)